MGFLADMIAKARGMLAAAPRDATDAIQHDPLDAAMFRELLADVPPLQDLVDDIGEHHGDPEGMVRDTIMRFWQGNPQLRDADEMAPGYELHHAVASMLADMPDLAELRAASMHDDYGSAVMTIGVADNVREYLHRHAEAAEATEQSREAAEQRTEAMEQLTEALAEAMAADEADDEADGDGEGEDGEGGSGSAANDLGETLRQAMQAASDADEAADDAAAQARAAAQQMAGQLAPQIRQQANEAKDEMEAEEAQLRSWGYEQGQIQRMSFTERRQLIDKLAGTRIGKFRELIGRFRMMSVAQQARRIEYAREDVIDVELSGDLTRVLPRELVWLADPDTEDIFFNKFLSGQLLSRKYAGTERGGDGAIVVCIDSSQSMEWHDGRYSYNGNPSDEPTPEAWSKAFTLALINHAKRNERDVHVIHFAGPHDELIEQRFPRGQADLSTLVDMAETFISGGTDFTKPLQRAAALIRSDYDKGRKKGDVVFITDGEAHTNPDFIERFNQLKHDIGFRVFAMMIGQGRTDAIEPFSDNTRNISEFVADEVADVFTLLR